VVSPAERAAERSVTRGVTDPPRSLCRTETRCARSMRPVRGISNRAPLKPQSKDRSLCVRRRVISQAGKLSRAYLRNAGTYWSYDRALLYRIPRSSACHSRDPTRVANSIRLRNRNCHIRSALYTQSELFLLPKQSKSDVCTALNRRREPRDTTEYLSIG
jgi:hypothetical protein